MRNFCLFFLLFAGFNLFGQMHVEQGEWSNHQDKGIHQGFVMSDSLHIYSIDFKNNKFRNEQRLYANVYDKQKLTLKNSFEITPENKEGTQLDLVQIFSVQQTMILVMVESEIEKSIDKRIVLQIINSDGTRGKTVIADTLPSQQNVNEDFQVIVDKTETGFVICTNYPVSLEENQKLKITAFNANLSQKWNKTIEFPNKEKQFIFSDWRYDGDQKVFFLARHIIDLFQSEMEFTTLTHNSFFLWSFDNAKDKLKEIELSLNQRFIHKITLELDANRWILAGIFSNDKKFHSDGVFNLILDKDAKVISHTIHNFTVEEQRLFNVFDQPKINKKGIDEIQMKNIQLMQNGEFVLVGEEFYKEIEEPNDGRMSPTNFTEVFYYQNIALFWFESTGALKGTYSIPKNQMSINDHGMYSSFAQAQDDSQLYFFFNDHPKNLSIDNPTGSSIKPISSNRKTYLKGIQIDNKGVIRKKVVHAPSKSSRIQASAGAQLLDGFTYFLVQKRRRKAILKIEFP
ncbi:MAG: hypothetical protein WC044_02555 [Crocinitomicaceae bacterium]